MEITKYKVNNIIYPHGEYRLSKAAEIIDEGSFYRVDGTHIFDKFKILSLVIKDRRIEMEMKDNTIILEVME